MLSAGAVARRPTLEGADDGQAVCPAIQWRGWFWIRSLVGLLRSDGGLQGAKRLPRFADVCLPAGPDGVHPAQLMAVSDNGIQHR